MTTNPNNAVGTNGAYSGRTSPNALNDVLASFTGRGILSGWACVPDSGMDVTVGGDGSHRDVAIAEDNAGNKVTVNNISQSPVSVTIPAAPANNSRIDSIVAYVENPPMGTSTDTDNPGTVGLIVVSGTVASTPVAPTDNQIRTGITADGAAGSTAYYVVLANVTVPSGITTITNTNISAGDEAITDNVSVTKSEIDWSTISKVLYNDNTGTTGDVLLSETSANFEYIEIFYRTNDQDYGSTKVYQPDGKKVSLSTAVHAIGTGELVYKVSIKEFDGVNLVKVTDGAGDEYGEASSASTNISHQNNVYITRVVGYYPQ